MNITLLDSLEDNLRLFDHICIIVYLVLDNSAL